MLQSTNLTPHEPKGSGPHPDSTAQCSEALSSEQDPCAECLRLPQLAGEWLSDTFLERRFHDDGHVNVEGLAQSSVISFLSKTAQTDEYYILDKPCSDLAAGLYRVRVESGAEPLLTIKKHGDGLSHPAETVDLVKPAEALILSLRNSAQLVAVVEKTRVTYKSRQIGNCLLHQDSVRGLGDFLDLKADTQELMDKFLISLGLDKEVPLNMSYRNMKNAKGIDPTQLKVWKFHEKFKDYIMGVVSGTLTPLGFLSATLASQQSKTAMIIALFSAGICDGMSDAVASSQTTQSDSAASTAQQVRAFFKTMAGKAIIPMTFVPIVLGTSSNLKILGLSVAWASVLLATTAAIQAVANENPIAKAVKRILFWGAGTTAAGVLLGSYVPKILERLF